jgi:hypothetical protein
MFKEVAEMWEDLKELFLRDAEEEGWLKKRDELRTQEIARGLKQDNIPIHVIVKNTGLAFQEVESL